MIKRVEMKKSPRGLFSILYQTYDWVCYHSQSKLYLKTSMDDLQGLVTVHIRLEWTIFANT